MLWVSPAVAEAAMRSGVARKQINLDEYREQLAERLGFGERLRRLYHQQSESCAQTPRLPGGRRIDDSARRGHHCRRSAGQPILIGRSEIIQKKVQELGLHFTPQIVDSRQRLSHGKIRAGFLRTAPAARPHTEPGPTAPARA